MREKVKEYISELETEIERCENAFIAEKYLIQRAKYVARVKTLIEVVNDLNGRLDEVI